MKVLMMSSYTDINISEVAVFTAIIIGNILLITNVAGLAITIIQYGAVLCFLFKGEIHKAALLHFSFILLSLSAQGTLGMFESTQLSMYNYGVVKLVGPIRASYLVNIILTLILFINKSYIINRSLLLYKLFRVELYLGLSALIIGGLGLLLHPYYRFNAFLDNAIYMFVVLTSTYILLKLADESFIRRAYLISLSAIIASVVGCFICFILFGVSSKYSEYEIAYLADIVGIGAPALIIGIVFIKQRAMVLLLFAIYGFLMSQSFGGKSFFAIGFAFIVLFYLLFFDRKTNYRLKKSIHKIRMLTLGGVAVVLAITVGHVSTDSFAFYKAASALSIFSGDLGEISRSPYIRIASLINIIYEGLQNPFILLFGNGYGGYFEDSLNLFAGLDLSLGAWPEDVINTGRFPSGHDSVVTIPLFNGIIGVILSIKISLKYIKKIPFNYLNSVVFFWFVLKFYFNTIFAEIGLFLLLAAELNLTQVGRNKINKEGQISL